MSKDEKQDFFSDYEGVQNAKKEKEEEEVTRTSIQILLLIS